MISRLKIHLEGVDTQNSQLRVLLGEINQIEIDHLFGEHIIRHGGLDYLWEQLGHVDTERYVSNNLFDHILLFGGILVNLNLSQKLFQFIDLTFFVDYEELGRRKI